MLDLDKMRLEIAIPATVALAYRAYSRRSLTLAGIVVAALTAVVHALHPWSVFFALLTVFFLSGTAVTKVKHDVKAQLTVSASGSSGGESQRNHVQVLANSGIASVLILLHCWHLRQGNANEECWPYGKDLLIVGIVGNYAAVAADTFSSELGILSRSKPRLLTSWNLREVPPGTNGGVTLLGTMAGFLGALVIATTTVLIPFCSLRSSSRLPQVLGGEQKRVDRENCWTWQEQILWILFVTVWGGLGSLLDSALGGWLQASVIDNRTGKVVEGRGGRKVLVSGSDRGIVKEKETSRRIESGLQLLDNNAVNILMAFLMSLGGMMVASFVWEIPLQSILP